MIHYHGLPITPATAAIKAVESGHALVSFEYPEQLSIAAEVCQSFILDNGAFSAWRAGRAVSDWRDYYTWVRECMKMPNFDWAIIPDVIEGSEKENDALLKAWPHPKWIGAPVWHLNENLKRLASLATDWPRICLGSTSEFPLATAEWWTRMAQAMGILCDAAGLPKIKIHGLRMLDPAVFRLLPLASADSSNIGRNIGIDAAWGVARTPPTKESRALVMRNRIEAYNGATRWSFKVPNVIQDGLFAPDIA